MKRRIILVLAFLYTAIFKKLFKGQSVNVKDSFEIYQRNISAFFYAPIIFPINIVFNSKSFITAITFVKSKFLDSFTNIFEYFFVFNVHTTNRKKTTICFYGIYYALLRESFSKIGVMKTYLILIILCPFVGLAQPCETNPDYKRANIWHFGAGAGIDFNSGSPVPITGGQTGHTWEGFSTLCDTGGNLMFYSDGQTVWNKNHDVVENGTGLISHISSTQASLFVQHPDNDSMVYLFTTRPNDFSNAGFRFNKINTKSNSGLGSIVEKNQLLLNTSTEKVTAVKHRNGKDYWIIAHGYTTNSYFAYLLTKEGLITCPIESKTGNILIGNSATWPLNTQGNLISNYKGNQLLNTVLHTGKVDILNFNNNLGTIEFIDSVKFNSNSYCAAYNLNDKRFYIQTVSYNRDTSYYYYYESGNLHLIDFELSGQIQYMVNMFDNIYIGNIDSTHLSSITGLNDSIPIFNKVSISLSPSYTSIGLNNFSNSYHYTPSINFSYELDCILNEVKLYGQDTFNATTHYWFITKQGGTPLTNNTKDPNIEFEDTGLYIVRYIASNGTKSDTITKEVIILPKVEQNFLGSDTNWCVDSAWNYSIQAPNGMHCYEWNTGETTPSISVNTSGTYIAKITTPNFCVLYDTINIQVNSAPPTGFLGKDTAWCESENNSLILTAIDNMESYLWQDSSIGQTFEVNQTGSYHVAISDSNNCFAYDTIEIFIDTVPTILNSFLGEDVFWCEYIDTLITLSAPKGNYIYNWNNGSNANEIQEDSVGIYFVVISSIDGYCSIIDSIELYTNPQPDKPQIFQANDTLKTDALSDTYIWFKNNTAVGSNQNFLKLVDSGIYALIIQNEFGCENTSDTLHVYKLNRNEIAFSPILIYPNPFNNNIFIESTLEIKEVRIINTLGQLVYLNNIPSQIKNIETANLENGFYFIVIRDHNQNIYTYKIIKQTE
jgi:hypothetical protein